MEVANVVASIISAFGNGMDLFRRMTGKKPKKRGREATLSEEEAWLRDSLHHRPLEIQRSYHHHVSRHGPRYEIGDSIAHTSLAHTLLTLNSGLIKLINQALSPDSKKNDVSRRSLFTLSELAASDTLNALSQLSLRLNSQSQLTLQAPPRQPRENDKRKEVVKTDLKLKGGSGKAPPKKRPGPSPLLVRGGWVRPKSTSVVSAASSKSTSSKTSNTKHSRSKSEPVVPRSSKKPNASQPKESPDPLPRPLPRQRSHSDLPRPPSMLVVPSDFFLPQSQHNHHPHHSPEPNFNHQQASPPRPPKIPLHTRPNPNLHHPRPKSSGTMRSASTKIGEIPDSRFPSMLESVDEGPTPGLQSYDPRLVEYLMSTPDGVSPPEDAQTQPKKRGRGFRFWKKEDRSGQEVAAF